MKGEFDARISLGGLCYDVGILTRDLQSRR